MAHALIVLDYHKYKSNVITSINSTKHKRENDHISTDVVLKGYN